VPIGVVSVGPGREQSLSADGATPVDDA